MTTDADDEKTNCPMCNTRLQLSEAVLVATLQDYIERQGLWVSEVEAQEFIDSYKKEYKKLPLLSELWAASKEFAKIEAMDKKQLKAYEQKQEEKRKEQEREIKMKMLKLKAEKKEELERQEREREMELEAQRKIEAAKRQAQKLRPKFVSCPSCGEKNPLDSKFCLECGTPLG